MALGTNVVLPIRIFSELTLCYEFMTQLLSNSMTPSNLSQIIEETNEVADF